MILRNGGMDVFYVDESNDSALYAVTALAVPFLRKTGDMWNIAWPDHLQAAQAWRKRIARDLHIPLSKELHASKLVGGRGRFKFGNRQFERCEAIAAYRSILEWIDFVPDASIITVVGQRGGQLYGHDRLERSMYALFQRMRSQSKARDVNAMTFFDQGHPEYRALYRRARIHLPTGSMLGLGQRNAPLDMFVKDANEKTSSECIFTQTVDMIAYAALAKRRHELGLMIPEHQELGLHTLYDCVPRARINTKASFIKPCDGIVRL
jgi:hypothetical protein